MISLKEARAAQLLTVRALAERAGVAPSTVYLIENGRSIPRFAAIRAISEALGTQPGDIAEFAAAIENAGRGKAETRARHVNAVKATSQQSDSGVSKKTQAGA